MPKKLPNGAGELVPFNTLAQVADLKAALEAKPSAEAKLTNLKKRLSPWYCGEKLPELKEQI